MEAVLLKDAPNSQVAQGLVCLSGVGCAVTSVDWQHNVVNNPINRHAVAVALRGELAIAIIEPAVWVEREMSIGAQLVELGLPTFDQYQVEDMSKDIVGPHDRFVPAGLNRRQLLEAIGRTGLKLSGGKVESADCNGETLPTQAGVLTLDFAMAMQPTDMAGRPFNLSEVDQQVWSKEQGGDGLMTAEKVLYLFLRSAVERGRPLWSGASCRCANACGADYSLDVYWSAGSGLNISNCHRSAKNWNLGALPRKWQALGI